MGKDIKLTQEDVEKALLEATEKAKQEGLAEGEKIGVEKGKIEGENLALKNQSPFKNVVVNEVKSGENFALGQLIRAAAVSKGHGGGKLSGSSMIEIGKSWNESKPQAYSGLVNKTMQMGDFNRGGSMVPIDYSDLEIDYLKTNSVMRNGGATVIDMPNDNLSFRRNLSGATAYWVDEGGVITPSNLETGRKNMYSHKLGAIVVISNDLLRNPSAYADKKVQQDLLYSLGIEEDKKFLRGLGTEHTPKDVAKWMNSGNSNAMTATPTYLTKEADLLKCITGMANNNAPMKRPTWIMPTRVKYDLQSVRDANGNRVFESIRDGMLEGFPVMTTNHIPVNLGGGTATEVYLVDMEECIIGQNMSMELKVFEDGTYSDGTNVISGISTDETVVRAILKVDFMLLHDYSASMITGCTWGA